MSDFETQSGLRCNSSFITFIIYLGGSHLPPSSDTKIRVPALEKIAHPDWSPADMSNDIAILVLARTLTKEETSGRKIQTFALRLVVIKNQMISSVCFHCAASVHQHGESDFGERKSKHQWLGFGFNRCA